MIIIQRTESHSGSFPEGTRIGSKMNPAVFSTTIAKPKMLRRSARPQQVVILPTDQQSWNLKPVSALLNVSCKNVTLDAIIDVPSHSAIAFSAGWPTPDDETDPRGTGRGD